MSVGWSGAWRGFGVPSSWGRGDLGSAIPSLRDLASLYSAFPTPLPRGALHNNRKNSRGPQRGPLVFCTPSSLMQASLHRPASVQKKALKHCLRAFFRCSAVRGGFEPPVRLPVRQFSKLVVSATHPSHLSAQWVRCLHKRFGTANIG